MCYHQASLIHHSSIRMYIHRERSVCQSLTKRRVGVQLLHSNRSWWGSKICWMNQIRTVRHSRKHSSFIRTICKNISVESEQRRGRMHLTVNGKHRRRCCLLYCIVWARVYYWRQIQVGCVKKKADNYW